MGVPVDAGTPAAISAELGGEGGRGVPAGGGRVRVLSFEVEDELSVVGSGADADDGGIVVGSVDAVGVERESLEPESELGVAGWVSMLASVR
jgi:hypothetical protein